MTGTTLRTILPSARNLWIVMFSCVFLGCSRLAIADQTAADVFTPRLVATLKSVVDAEVSPNGKWIAYRLLVQRTPGKDDDGPAWVELHVADRQGNSRPFVTGKVSVGQIEWTPDGTQIAYLAQRNDDKESSLYVIPIDGGESRQLLAHTTAIQAFAFSADGQQLAFLATPPVSTEQQEAEKQGFNQQIYEEDTPATQVWIVDAQGKGTPRALPLDGSASDVSWNPNGTELAVVLAPTPSVDDSYMFKRVHVVDATSGRIVESIANPGKLGQVTWSPSGKQLAMISGQDIHDPSEGRLMVASVPGDGSLRDLLPGFEAHVSSFAWIDNTTIGWIADQREHTTVGTTSFGEGADPTTQIVSENSDTVVSLLSLHAETATAAVVGQSAQHPAEVFLLDIKQGNSTRLTHHNPELQHLRFAEQSVVTWTARDGLELSGVLIKPLNYVEGRRYPLILAVHGGPESHVPNGWVTSYSTGGQTAAARGFAVFYPNYRGSTGRGVPFSMMGQADAAGKEFDDLVDAVDHLINIGLVDRDRVGITGGSYGGYASAWGATYYSERFAASVMFVGISDNLSKVGTTDIPEEMFLVHHRKRLWDDWNYFLERSPIRYVERNRTPTLILHGKQDPRVHPSQSLELFRHLKTLKQAPVRLVLYEGEGHGNRKAAARLDYNLRLLRWMEHYLMGPGGEAPPFELDYGTSP